MRTISASLCVSIAFFQVISTCEISTIRLTGLSSTVAGSLEVCFNGTWSSLITSGWTNQDSIVVCNTLGFQSALDFTVQQERFLQLSNSTSCLSGTLSCTGTEESLTECSGRASLTPVNCDSDFKNTFIFCKDPSPNEVRLIGSTDSLSGVVEIYSSLYGWSTICTDSWDDSDAVVACRSLGYNTGRKSLERYSYDGLPPKRFNNFKCSGSESTITDCTHSGPFPNGCRTVSPARVSCNEAVTLDITLISMIVLLLAVTGCVIITMFSLLCYTKYHKRSKKQTAHLNENISPKREEDTWGFNLKMPAPPSYDDSCH